VQVRNQTALKIVKHIDIIIEESVTDEAIRSKLIVALQHYAHAMELLLLHCNLQEEEKELFQDLIDVFFELWLEIFGQDGMSNYIHLLGSGHILYFLTKYGCLYIYSQQGWEA
jgi:hypothetical protein